LWIKRYLKDMNKRGRPATGKKVVSGGMTLTREEWQLIDRLKGDSSRGEWLRQQCKDQWKKHGLTV
jgi:hypothetical protein|tara:strand:+ start:2769 stop:2966 length:198 start_codon:yes stop_codon:yes gene_type:complete